MNEEQLQFQQAVDAIDQGQYAEAEVLLQQVLVKNQSHIGALLSYSDCLVHQKRIKEALPLLGVLHSSHPENTEFAVKYAKSLREEKRFTDAVYPLKALLKQPATAEVVALLAETYSDCGDKLNAMAYVHWALSLDEKSFEGLALVIDLYKDQNQLVQAIHYCTLLIRHHPGYLKARLRLGDLHEKNDQLDKALEQYLFVRTKEPLNAALWTLTGRLRTDLHQLEQD